MLGPTQSSRLIQQMLIHFHFYFLFYFYFYFFFVLFWLLRKSEKKIFADFIMAMFQRLQSGPQLNC